MSSRTIIEIISFSGSWRHEPGRPEIQVSDKESSRLKSLFLLVFFTWNSLLSCRYLRYEKSDPWLFDPPSTGVDQFGGAG